MKKLFFIIIVATVAFSCSKAPEQAATVEQQPIDSAAIVLDAIAQRHSVRHFTTEAIPADTLELLARAGMAAPTACNKQPWAIMAINDRIVLDTLYSAMQYSETMAKAPAAIVVCGDMSKAMTEIAREFWIQDCSAMTENILVAIHALGLGAVWTGVHPIPERLEAVRNTLNLPDNIIPLCVILVGHPEAGADEVKDKWLPENYHLNKW